MPVSLKVLESKWEAAFNRYRLAVRQYGSGSREARAQWEEANSAINTFVESGSAGPGKPHRPKKEDRAAA